MQSGRRDRTRVALVLLVLLIAFFYFFALRSLFVYETSNAAAELYAALRVGVELSLLLFLIPAYASSAITQEREQQTWNALLLTRLTASEIVLGKYIGVLLPSLLLLSLFAPLGIASAIIGGIGWKPFLISTILLLSVAFFCAALGLYFSWARRRTYQATAGAFGVIAFLTVGTWILYGLYELTGGMRGSPASAFPLFYLNPYFAMSDALNRSESPTGAALIAIPLYLLAAAGMLALIITRLRRGAKELEQ